MDQLIANSLEHLRASDARDYIHKINMSHGGMTLVLNEEGNGEFVELSIGDDYAYAASLPTKDGILWGFNTYDMDRRISHVSDDEYHEAHFEQAKQDAITKAHRQFGHVDTAPLAAVFRGMAPPDPSFKPPRYVPVILKKMAEMVRSGKATITGFKRSDVEIALKSGDRATLSIFTKTFDEYFVHKIPGFRITVSSADGGPAATYTALMPTRSTARSLFYMLRNLNPEIEGVMAMRLFGEEADPNANMFTDEVMDYIIAHTKHVGEDQFVRDMQENHGSALAQLAGDSSVLTKGEKTAARIAMAKANDKYPGLRDAFYGWGKYRGVQVLAGFADMVVM